MEFLSPVMRKKQRLLIVIFFLFVIFFGLFQLIPDIQKNTVYFTVKEPGLEGRFPMDPPESASKVAEAIAGWAKDPAFREEILKTSGVSISKFKKKISARKQNRMNVFWTLKFYPEDLQYADKVTQALISVLEKEIQEVNQNNAYPILISQSRVYSELQNFPQSWKAGAALFLALVLGFISIYALEMAAGKLSFIRQIRDIFPNSPMLRMPTHVEGHDEKVLEQFILTFQAPRLVGTFPLAEKHFTLAPADTMGKNLDTPILLVRLGDTPLHELENLQAIFGEEIGVVVFER